MDPEEQVNKSNQDVHVWRMNGDNGESLILLLLFWGGTYLALEAFEGNEMLSILFFFSLRWVSCTSNSTFGHLSIFTSRLSFSFYFFPFFEVSGTCPFLFPRIHFFSEHSPSWNNVASGSNQNISSIYFTGNNRDRKIFLAILSRIRSRIILGESGDGICGWYFRSRSSMYEWTCKWILILTTWQAPKGLHSLTTLNAHKQ